MPQRVRFHFDPACPWAWQSSKWMREVATARGIEIDWRFFSLAMVNADGDEDVEVGPALRLLANVRREHGNERAGRLYEALGTRTHDAGEDMGASSLADALRDVGLDPALLDAAAGDEDAADAVRADHRRAVDEVGCFGVPTIVLASGRGIFGPVVAVAPTGEDAGRLWDHVSWLADQDTFFELKRERDRGPGEIEPGGAPAGV